MRPFSNCADWRWRIGEEDRRPEHEVAVSCQPLSRRSLLTKAAESEAVSVVQLASQLRTSKRHFVIDCKDQAAPPPEDHLQHQHESFSEIPVGSISNALVAAVKVG